MMNYRTTPSAEQLRELSTPELGLVLLANLGSQPHMHNLMVNHKSAHRKNEEPDVDRLLGRVSDTWAWLVAEGCVGPDPKQSSGWYRVTERGQRLSEEGTLSNVFADQRIPEDIHEQLRESRTLFRGGKIELGVFAAMREVEVSLRDKSGSSNDLIGVALARQALHPEKGPLADNRLEKGECQAIADLYAGALGAFKNPTSHRVVDYEDPARAADVIVLADLLLRMLDEMTADPTATDSGTDES